MLTIALALALNSSAVVRDDPFVDLMQSRLPADYVGCNAEYTKWYSTWKARANELTIAKKGEYETTQEFDARKAALRKRLYDVPFPPPGKSKYFAYQVEVETTYNADRGEIKFHAFIDDGVRFSVQGDPAAYIGFISTSLAFKQPDLFRYEGRGTKGPGDRYHFEGTVPCERERAPELRANMRALVACTVDPIDRWSVFPPRSTYLFPYVELFPAFQMIGAILYSEKTGEVLVRKTNFAAAKAEICLRHLRVLSFGVNAHTKANNDVYRLNGPTWETDIVSFLMSHLRHGDAIDHKDDLFRCPDDPDGTHSFSYNGAISGHNINTISHREKVVLLYEGRNGKLRFHADGTAAVVFADDRAKRVTSTEAKNLVWKP